MGLFGRKKISHDLGGLPPPPLPEDLEEDLQAIGTSVDMDLPPPPVDFPDEMSGPYRGLSKLRTKPLPDVPPPPVMANYEEDEAPEHIMDGFGDLEKELPDVPSLEELEHEMPSLEDVQDQDMHEIPQMLEEPAQRLVPAREVQVKKGPRFMNIHAYKEVLAGITDIKRKLNDADLNLKRMQEIKEEGDSQFEKFRMQLEDLQRKSTYVDRRLFEGGIRR